VAFPPLHNCIIVTSCTIFSTTIKFWRFLMGKSTHHSLRFQHGIHKSKRELFRMPTTQDCVMSSAHKKKIPKDGHLRKAPVEHLILYSPWKAAPFSPTHTKKRETREKDKCMTFSSKFSSTT